MAKALTAKFTSNVKPTDARQEIADAACPGLYLVVQPSGGKSWAFRFRIAGKPKKLTIGPVLADRAVVLPDGVLPDLGEGHTLAEARAAAGLAGNSVKEGGSPVDQRKKIKMAAAAGSDTAGGALDDFLSQHVEKKNRPSTARETRRFIDLYLRPEWGEKKLKRISKSDIGDMLHSIEERGGPASANRVLAIISKFFNWAVDKGLLTVSPAKGVKAPAKLVSRDRVLSDDEIRFFWKATGAFGYPFGPLWRMLLLTVQRREEVAGAMHTEFSSAGNDRSWLIPRERAKNGRENLLPLPGAVLDIIDALPIVSTLGADGKSKVSPFLFTTTGETSVSGYSKAKERLDKKMLEIARQEATEAGRDPEEVEIPEWRLHDLRRTAASGMAALSFPIHVVEAVINHKSGTVSGVAAIYNRHEYLEEKRAALAAWARKVEQITGSSPASNVIPLLERKSS